MFKTDSFVFHRRCGICRVSEIAPLSGDPSGNLYYVLNPLYGEDRGTLVRVPVENASSLSEPISKEEAEQMVLGWPSPDEDLYILDSKQRKLAYEGALAKGSLTDLAKLLQGARQRKARDGHLNSMDSQFVSRAEPLVLGELSMALGIPYEAVGEYISTHAGN